MTTRKGGSRPAHISKPPFAMVKPVPSRSAMPEDVIPTLELSQVLQQLGNDRPYTLIRSHGNSWKVLFLGDHEPSVITIVKGKPVVTHEKG